MLIRPELLAPGGSKEAFIAAVNCGADAVYLGGKSFSARASAANFDKQELAEIIDFCHLRGVKTYIALNTLFKERELPKVLRFAEKVANFGADAFIMQDLGTFAFLKKHIGDAIEFHASTQMTAHSVDDALFLAEIGFSRIVISRELNLAEIADIARNCGEKGVKIEVFAHGALCYSYSGACFMSSYFGEHGERSGNRGMCAQPCRLKYTLMQGKNKITENLHLISPKDLMTIGFLDELQSAGVSSLKIEGRLKSPEYVAITVSAYKKALDFLCDGKPNNEIRLDKHKLAAVFNRGGFTSGYLNKHSCIEMMSPDSPKHMGTFVGRVSNYNAKTGMCCFTAEANLVPGDGLEIWTKQEPHVGAAVEKHFKNGETAGLNIHGAVKIGDKIYRSFDKTVIDEAKRLAKGDRRKIPVNCSTRISSGDALYVSLEYKGIYAECHGETVQNAIKAPLCDDDIKKQLEKSGEFPFDITVTDLKNDGVSFVAVKELNEARRQACALLSNNIRVSGQRSIAIPSHFPQKEQYVAKKSLSVFVNSSERLHEAIIPGVSRIYTHLYEGFFDELSQILEICHNNDIKLFATLPRIGRNGTNARIIEKLEKTPIDGYLVRTHGQLYLLKNSRKQKVADFCFNITNSMSNEIILNMVNVAAISAELSPKEIKFAKKGNEILIYGRLPLAVTALCPVGIYEANKNGKKHCSFGGKNKESVARMEYAILDRTKAMLPIITNCEECYAEIFADKAINHIKDFENGELSIGGVRVDFITENPDVVRQIVYRILKNI